MGDFNIDLLRKHNASISNSELSEHILTCREFNLCQRMEGPTHTIRSLLDHVYVNSKHKFNTYGHFPFAGSDHDLLCYLSLKSRKVKIPAKIISYRSLKDINEEKFIEDLMKFQMDSLNPLTTSFTTCDTIFQMFNEHTMKTIEAHAPLKRRLVKGIVTPWYTAEVAKVTKQKNNEIMRQRSSTDNHPLTLYKALKRK